MSIGALFEKNQIDEDNRILAFDIIVHDIFTIGLYKKIISIKTIGKIPNKSLNESYTFDHILEAVRINFEYRFDLGAAFDAN